jgi:hypothetical protein
MQDEVVIIVHDNGSDDPATLAALDRLESTGVAVVRGPAISSADDLNLVDRTVQAYFASHSPDRYIVSDCDIDIGVADPRALAIYSELLDRFPEVECVGPMLRIRDVPSSYPLFNRLMNRHIAQFWRHRPSWVETAMGRIAYQAAPIDTTLALHRADAPFARLRKGVRVYEPFEALHLDWYLRPGEMLEYWCSSNAAISHWNNAAEQSRYASEALEYSSYYWVGRGDNGLEERQQEISAEPSHLSAASPLVAADEARDIGADALKRRLGRRSHMDEAGQLLAPADADQGEGPGVIGVPVGDPVGAVAHGLGGDEQGHAHGPRRQLLLP